MKIYTKTGDDGTTSLFSGGRVPKHHLRVESYGTIDELNSTLGLARAQQPTAGTDAYLARIQHQLFNLGADLATPLDAPNSYVVRMDAATVAWLEQGIDQMTGELPPLTYFILPGGTAAAAAIHMGRTVCRRAERVITALVEHEPIGDQVLPYVNRLSDFLFTLARWENHQVGGTDVRWTP
ncbi:MAG: cob(I)yrinic acid a,c-diamide adenosyltransferase [Chloroflexi bacterium]|uniref:cob(I)yrinic acid a,c-diamide adenosyltransferase n=1 Tax=Candidatus Flexifilum breve TaxID=3140694 RepID=UPI00313539E8|nr:cob(I)yrinic acid a,c-diamide adenosyltransferase [Chloroflexota bacterium]MBK9749137.1 cob(I)yrinic acid a,c-diamide adenosyltransferase [Chloroflexota bacterium]